MSTFVMLKRGDVSEELISHHPNAFLLLTLIALRARRTPNIIRNLDVCECHIGDFDACGLTRQQYRTAQKILESFNLATFQPTNKGTIAKLINTDIYDINPEDSNQQDNHQATIKQPSSNQPPNHQATTNNNVNNLNNENNENNVIKVNPFETHLGEIIKDKDLSMYSEKIIEFYNYRMAMKKKDQYQTEKGINGLIRNVLELKNSSLDVNDSLEYAMEKNWKSPELKYFNTAVKGKPKTFDDFVNEGFEKNKRTYYG